MISRRVFIVNLFLTALLLPKREVFGFFRKVRIFIRPPGAIAEDEFLKRCIKCGACVQVCPQRVIVPLSLSDTVVGSSTPTMNFNRGYCDLCMRCVSICPTDAIVEIDSQDVKIGLAVIDKVSCVAWDWQGCVVCVERCPEKAIYLDDEKRPHVISELCNGCGLCELICPSTSLRSGNTYIEKGVVVKVK